MPKIHKLKKIVCRIIGDYLYDYINFEIIHPNIKKFRYIPLSKKRRKQKVEPWAFIRVKNEIITISACLESILPVIKKGVIGYTPSDDGTDEFIIDFCKKNKGFIPFKYDYDVIPADDIRYKEDYDKRRGLDAYYNAVLDKIPNGEWFIKIDCDHIYDTKKLEQLSYLPKNDDDCIWISRLNLHYNNKKLYLLKNNPYLNVGDHWLLKKTDKLLFTLQSGHTENPLTGTHSFYAWEHLDISHLNWIKTDLINWHFPLMKKSRKNLNVDLIDFDDYPSILDLKKRHISKYMMDKERILKIVESFKLND